MFGFAKKEQTEARPEFREARDMTSLAIHIEHGDAHEVLCGSSRAMYGEDKLPVTAKKVIESIPKQHGGWHWCATCASTLTGLGKEEVIAGRQQD